MRTRLVEIGFEPCRTLLRVCFCTLSLKRYLLKGSFLGEYLLKDFVFLHFCFLLLLLLEESRGPHGGFRNIECLRDKIMVTPKRYLGSEKRALQF